MMVMMMTMRSLFVVQLLIKTMEQLFVVPEGNSVPVYHLKIYTNTCIKVYYYLIYIFISPPPTLLECTTARFVQQPDHFAVYK